MKTRFHFRLPRRHFKRGFALIATLSMMILLTLIAVGLLTLSTVTVRSGKAEADLAIARANARLGMMTALNQLQKLTGPDQRVTAPADLKFPSANMPRWIGVYGNQARADYSQAPSTIPSQPYQPALLNWLVSGNESVQFDASTSSSDFGKITSAPSSFPFNPTDAVSGLTSGASGPTIGGKKAALLVGGGSTMSANSAKDYVAAPIVTITDSTGTNVKGGYAYWVGDEGMKARIDLRDNYRQQTSASEIDKAKAYSFQVSQRSGIEMMRKDNSTTSKIGSDYDPASTNLKKLATTQSLPLLNTSLKSNDVLKYRFHDVTAYSKSVIADSYAGGLKRDMSSAVYANAGPANTDPLFTPESASFGLPTWGHVRSWVKQTAPPLSNPASPPSLATVQPYTSTQTRFGPVIMGASMGIGVAQEAPGTLRLKLYPTLILWNPHDVALPAHDYELGLAFPKGASGLINVQLAKPPNFSYTNIGNFSLSSGDANLALSGSGTSNFFRFRVKGSPIPAGEAHLYLADDPGFGATAYTGGTAQLVRVPSTSPIGLDTRCFHTNKTITFNPVTYPSDSRFRISSALTGGSFSNNCDRFEAVLTEPGGLSGGLTTTTPVYQALLDMAISGGPNYGDSLTLSNIGVTSTMSNFSIRSLLIMGGGGAINSQWLQIGAMRLSPEIGIVWNRWLASQNPLAPFVKRTKVEQDCQLGAFSHGCVSFSCYDSNNTLRALIGMTSLGGAGSAHLAGVGGEPAHRNPGPFLDVLPTGSSTTTQFLSLGQLQHAQLSPYVFGPTYTFGNSWANLDIPRNSQYVGNQVARPGFSPLNFQDPIYDLPWHLNRALWDRYFVSGAPSTVNQADIDDNKPLPNARMSYYARSGKRPTPAQIQSSSTTALTEAAANLLVNGGFNINSTSEDAWRALLTGTNKFVPTSELGNTSLYSGGSASMSAPIARFSRDVRTDNSTGVTGVSNMWGNRYRGNRELVPFCYPSTSETPAQAQDRLNTIAQILAHEIVVEIRQRGPFLSLGDFVNRRLVADDSNNNMPPSSSSPTSATGIRGALSAALARSGNTTTSATTDAVNPAAAFGGTDLAAPGSHLHCPIAPWFKEHYAGSLVSEAPNGPAASKDADAPKYLTQGDLLSTFGPQLSARSDTFTIRSYGESLDSTGKTTARAWCEAVVQRVPDFVDPADAASLAPASLTKTLNKTLGRRFEIVSFRWLTSEEI